MTLFDSRFAYCNFSRERTADGTSINSIHARNTIAMADSSIKYEEGSKHSRSHFSARIMNCSLA